MRNLLGSLFMGFLCVTVWLVAAPILNEKAEIEKESKLVIDELEAQTLTML